MFFSRFFLNEGFPDKNNIEERNRFSYLSPFFFFFFFFRKTLAGWLTKVKVKVGLFVTYTIIQSTISSEMQGFFEEKYSIT